MFEGFLDDNEIDVVQAHNLHLDFFELSRALETACRARGVPVYLVMHNDAFIDRSEETTHRIVREIDWAKLVPISETIRQSMMARLPGIHEDKWQVIIHGIDIETFSPAAEEKKEALRASYGLKDRRVILHPGRFLPWKGILPAIKSMPRVIEDVPNALMVMTGRAQRIYKDRDELAMYDAKIDRTIWERGPRDHVHIGTYTHEDIPRLTALSEVMIYTTIGKEPSGWVPVEGMACGAPVVTDSGGLTESVVDGKTGFVISKDEEKGPQELARRLIQVLSDEALAERLGEQGRRRAEDLFDKGPMATDFIQLSESLVDQSGPVP